MSESQLSWFLRHFGNVTVEDLEKILKSKLPDDEKIICIKGWLKLYRMATYQEK